MTTIPTPPNYPQVFLDCTGVQVQAEPTAFLMQRPDGIYQWYVAVRHVHGVINYHGAWRRMPIDGAGGY